MRRGKKSSKRCHAASRRVRESHQGDAISQIQRSWSEGRSIPTRRTELPALTGNDAAIASHP